MKVALTVATWLGWMQSLPPNPRRFARSESSAKRSGSFTCRVTTRLENAHGTDFREVLIAIIRGLAVRSAFTAACEVRRRVFPLRGGGGHGDCWLEVLAWMFERASCPRDLRLTAAPFVSQDALAGLFALLDRALKTSMASSNAPLSGASRSSHDQFRGEAHASGDGGDDERRQAQTAARTSADGSVRQRQAGVRPRRSGRSGHAWR